MPFSPCIYKRVWEFKFCSSIIPQPHAHLVLWKNTILVGSVFPSNTSDETKAVRHQSSAQRQKSERKIQTATSACSSKGLFQLELVQRHLSCQSWDLEFRATLSSAALTSAWFISLFLQLLPCILRFLTRRVMALSSYPATDCSGLISVFQCLLKRDFCLAC